MHVDDVVEVSRTTALGESPELLTEKFSDGVAHDATHWKRVAVGVSDRTKHTPVHENLVRGEVELHHGERRWVVVGASVGDPPLGR